MECGQRGRWQIMQETGRHVEKMRMGAVEQLDKTCMMLVLTDNLRKFRPSQRHISEHVYGDISGGEKPCLVGTFHQASQIERVHEKNSGACLPLLSPKQVCLSLQWPDFANIRLSFPSCPTWTKISGFPRSSRPSVLGQDCRGIQPLGLSSYWVFCLSNVQKAHVGVPRPDCDYVMNPIQ